MPKFQEIKVKKKSLRDILPPKHEHSTPPPPPVEAMRIPSEYHHSQRGGWGWPVWVILIVVMVAVIGYVSTRALARVTIELTPAPVDIALDETLKLSRDSGGLGFDVITLPSQTGVKTVKASGTERVNRPASGTIVIYNNYSKESQRLIANTRFQAKNGKIYRIREAVTVPGIQTIAGKSTPGFLEVTVYADIPGAEGNSEATDFTIPGLKGDPRYDKIYARSKTPLTGGVVGEIKKLLPADERAARTALRAEVTEAMLKEARAKIPASFVLFDDLTKVDIKDASDLSAGTGGEIVTLKEALTLQGLMLPRQSLVEHLVGSKVPNFTANELLIANLSELDVSFTSLPEGNLADSDSLVIKVRGSAHLVPRIDVALLAGKLVGMGKDEVNSVLNGVKGLERARVVFRPPWLSKIPANSSRIKIKILSI